MVDVSAKGFSAATLDIPYGLQVAGEDLIVFRSTQYLADIPAMITRRWGWERIVYVDNQR